MPLNYLRLVKNCCFITVIVLIVLSSKTFGQSAKTEPIRIRIDLKNHSEDIGTAIKSCSFIPLETSKDCLVGRVALAEKHGENFFLTNIRDNMLMSFNEEGEFISNHIRLGKGPGELVDPFSFMIDYKNDNVVIFSWDKKSNFYFTIDGTFKKEVPNKINNEGMVLLDDGSTAYYTGKPYNIINDKRDYSYLIISDSLSKVGYRGIDRPTIKKSGFVMYQSFPRYKNEVYFKHPYPDTIYKIDHLGAKAKYVIDFGKHQIDWRKIKPDPTNKNPFSNSQPKQSFYCTILF